MRLYLRRGVYYVDFFDARGNRQRITTHCTDKRAAEAAGKRLERAAHGAPDAAPDAAPYALHAALKDFLTSGCLDASGATAEMYRQKAGHVGRLLGDLELLDLKLDDVIAYTTKRLDEGAARESIRKELVTLRRAVDLARRRGLFLRDVAVIMPEFKVRYVPRKRFLTIEEFRALLAAFQATGKPKSSGAALTNNPARQLWLVVAVFTGGRYSEVAGLDWSDINWARKVVHLRGTKTDGSDRTVPLHPVLEAVLVGSRQARGPVVGVWPNVRRDMVAACARAHIPPATPNDLRRTFGSWLKQAGVDSFAVGTLMGHASGRMVELVYGRLDERTLTGAMQFLPGGDPCAVFVPQTRPYHADPAVSAEEPKPAIVGKLKGYEVLGPGIEPGTRGFSIRAQSKISTRNNKIKRRGTSGV